MNFEQSFQFHIARRILKTIAPDYRLITNGNLAKYESALDHDRKTVEIGEHTPVMDGIGILLFQIGHLRLISDKKFSTLFGKGFRKWKNETELVSRLMDLSKLADQEAAKWAIESFQMYWSVDIQKAEELVSRNVWTNDEWKDYWKVA